MTPEQAREQLQRVFTAYPSYRKYLAEVNDDADQANATFDAWVRMLTPLNLNDLRQVVNDIIAGSRSPKGSQYDTPDMLPLTLRARANQIVHERERAGRMNQYRKQSARGSFETVGSSIIGQIAVTIGAMLKNHVITKEENDQRMRELLAWDGDGIEPDWLREVRTWHRDNERKLTFVRNRSVRF